MTVYYEARYTDRFGQESTSIANDGATLSMVVRGVEFKGSDFDSLEPVAGTDADRLASPCPTLNRAASLQRRLTTIQPCCAAGLRNDFLA